MTKRNFLLGKGERLISDVQGVRGGGPKGFDSSSSVTLWPFAAAKRKLLAFFVFDVSFVKLLIVGYSNATSSDSR